MTRPSLPNSFEPVGHRRDGLPIYPILGASPDDDSNKPGDASGTPSGGVTQEGPVAAAGSREAPA